MQILQWIFNQKQEEEEARETTTTTSTNKNTVVAAAKEVTESKDLVKYKTPYNVKQRSIRVHKGNAQQKEVYSLRIFLCRGGVRECFYSTLNLKKLGSFPKGSSSSSSSQQYCFHPRRGKQGKEAQRMGHKADQSPAHVGNKVLPICDASVSATTSDDQCGSSEKKEKPNSGSGDNKNKAISRMKELLRWAATAKTDKAGGKYISRKVLHFRNRSAGGKTSAQDDNERTSSPKISFRWETLSCSTTSSAHSALSLTTPSRNDRKSAAKRANNSSDFGDNAMASDQCNGQTTNVGGDGHKDDSATISRAGNWITTDSEFVVLEL